jgi:hypothetical protein
VSCELEATLTASLARCDAEQDLIRKNPDVVAGTAPAYLVVLGLNDWEHEKRLIWEEACGKPHCGRAA